MCFCGVNTKSRCVPFKSLFVFYQHEDWDWVEANANDIALIMLSDVVDLDDPFVAVVDLAPSGL